MKVVVILVLSLLFILPTLQLEVYVDTYLVHNNGFEILVDLYNEKESWSAYQTAVALYGEQMAVDNIDNPYPALILHLPDPNGTPFNTVTYDWVVNQDKIKSDISEYRPDEYSSILLKADNGFDFAIIYSTRSYLIVESIINISRTVFVSVVIAIAAIYFQKDANNLVLHPIERMLEKVRLIA